ncbi:hypothetical protein D4759_06185 [Clostridiales bacterium AHG0011]|nr:hypothetical protein [Clostridiales bacterium AHG0011]
MGGAGRGRAQAGGRDGRRAAGRELPSGKQNAKGRDGNRCPVPAFTARLCLRTKESCLLFCS